MAEIVRRRINSGYAVRDRRGAITLLERVN
jgi:hypothetical protein